MNIKLSNIGKLSKADIEICGITVIAGENNTGKSTVGKTLFSVFNSFFNIEKAVSSARINFLSQDINKIFNEKYTDFYLNNSRYIATQLLDKKEFSTDYFKELLNSNVEYISFGEDSFDEGRFEVSDEFSKSISEKYETYKNIPEKQIYTTIFNGKIRDEFHMQLCNEFFPNEESEIELTINNKSFNIQISNNKTTAINEIKSLNCEAIYIDNPFILDELFTPFRRQYNSKAYRKECLKRKLLKNNDTNTDAENALREVLVNQKLENLFTKINSVCDGLMIFEPGKGFVYKNSNTPNGLDIINTSAGLKTFIIIKTLLLNGSLEEKGVLILDEPEIHLHPQWQLLFAEIVVLLQKEFNMHILLNTHSPYFLEAIETYSEFHGISEKCRFYLSENDGNIAYISDVTKDTTPIYQKLARPYQILEDIQSKND